MAEIIPDRLPVKASRGEERTFAFLKKLPDDYLVYYEPNIDNRHPDFIVIAPDLGVIVIEVKGWYLPDIIQANDTEVITNYNNQEKRELHPLEQARNYQWKLVRTCENSPKKSLLLHKEGKYQNKFIFPFCHFVILSNISQEGISKEVERDLTTIFRPDNTMFKEELRDLEYASPETIRQTLRRFFHPFWNITPFTPEQVDVLRSIIHPEIILSYVTSRSLTAKENEECCDLVVLDRKQENNARKIGEGHRIIYGVAGSGKTVLLISRAKWLYDQNPGTRILLLCYNVALSAYLKHTLEHFPDIKVCHFDGWAKENGITRKNRDPETGNVENDASLGKRLLEYLQGRNGDYRKYDAVLIDEAQDFHPCWFSCILEAMSDPDDGDLLIVCDGNQGIHLVDTVSWKSLGVHAQGRTIHRAFDLDRNYRNTREILQVASHFASRTNSANEDSISIVPVDPSQAVRRGPRPILMNYLNLAEECTKVENMVKRFLNQKITYKDKPVTLQPKDIGILYPRIPYTEKERFSQFVEDLSQIAPVTWLNKNRNSRTKVFDPSIKVQTVASSKGLQYRAVILMWAGLFDHKNPGDADMERKLMYVALTRASDVLIVTYSQENELVEIMRESGDLVVK